jgi:hypothetical protein
MKRLSLTTQTTCGVGKLNGLAQDFSERRLIDFEVVDIARCLGQETQTLI